MRIAFGGFQHETNTFAPSKARFEDGDGLARGTLLGNALALGCSLSYAAALVAMRKGRAVDMIPAVCLAGLLAALVAAAAAALGTPAGLAVSGRDLGLAASLGVVQLGFQYILLTFAIRHVPAAEVALIGRASLVLAPIWVWFGVGEVPSALTLAGGAAIFLAITSHGFLAIRRSRVAPQSGARFREPKETRS